MPAARQSCKGGEEHDELARAVSDPAHVRHAEGHAATRDIPSTTPRPSPYSRGIYAMPYAILPKRPERDSRRPPAVFRHSVTRSMSRAPRLSHFHMLCHMFRHMSRPLRMLLPEVSVLVKKFGPLDRSRFLWLTIVTWLMILELIFCGKILHPLVINAVRVVLDWMELRRK